MEFRWTSAALLSIFLVHTLAQSDAYAQTYLKAPRCESIFNISRVEVSRESTHQLVQEQNTESIRNLSVLNAYPETHKKLGQTLFSFSDIQRSQNIQHLLDSTEFFDYGHTSSFVWDRYFSTLAAPENLNFHRLYDSSDQGLFHFGFGKSKNEGLPFRNFIEAKSKFRVQSFQDLNLELIQSLHAQLMKGGVENVPVEQLGIIRFGNWWGGISESQPISESVLKIIESNPYLTFRQEKKGFSNSPLRSVGEVWLSDRRTEILHTSQSMTTYSGKINYPHPLLSKPETIELVKDTHPDLYSRIQKLRLSMKGFEQISPKELDTEFIRALTQNRIDQFKSEVSGLHAISNHQEAYIRLVASLVRDLVSIHPLANGNGRTTRFLMNLLLEAEGIAPARLLDPNTDLYSSEVEWQNNVLRAVINRSQLEQDFLYRIKNNLTVENSPEFLYPSLPETIKVDLRKEGKSEVVQKEYLSVPVDGKQFSVFVETLMEVHPEYKARLKTERALVMSEMVQLFTEFYRSKTIDYIHSKDGERIIQLRLVDRDFYDHFAELKIQNPQMWQEKMNRWYDQESLVWRGLSSKHHEYTDQELLDLFIQVSPHMASNRVLRHRLTGEASDLLRLMKEDFKIYNKELLTGELITMAEDHHRTGPMYGQSYGYSTSKREVVGKAFAMGAMVVGKYGEHQDPSLQSK